MTNRTKTILAVVAVVLVIGFIASFFLSQRPSTPSSTPTPSVSQAPVETQEAPAPSAEGTPAESSDAVTLLDALVVAEPTNRDSYDRALFPHWSGMDGCDTRVAVLLAEATVAPQQDGCTLIGGQWFSRYDGVTVTNARDLDIDHMVPLAEAWQSGAYAWTTEQREAYANDLGYEDSLIAVTASTNRSKSDQDPSTWMPALDQCWYVEAWVAVKFRWNLTVDVAEEQVLRSTLTACGDTGGADVSNVQQEPMQTQEAAAPSEPAAPVADSAAGTDPQFSSCSEAQANGYGPYTRDVDPEYAWYRDGDGDGQVCE